MEPVVAKVANASTILGHKAAATSEAKVKVTSDMMAYDKCRELCGTHIALNSHSFVAELESCITECRTQVDTAEGGHHQGVAEFKAHIAAQIPTLVHQIDMAPAPPVAKVAAPVAAAPAVAAAPMVAAPVVAAPAVIAAPVVAGISQKVPEWSYFDSDADGVVEERELFDALMFKMKESKKDTPAMVISFREQVQARLPQVDANHDGDISKAEFNADLGITQDKFLALAATEGGVLRHLWAMATEA